MGLQAQETKIYNLFLLIAILDTPVNINTGESCSHTLEISNLHLYILKMNQQFKELSREF